MKTKQHITKQQEEVSMESKELRYSHPTSLQTSASGNLLTETFFELILTRRKAAIQKNINTE
jgi:hypothetical protein